MTETITEKLLVLKVDQGRGNEAWLTAKRENGEKIFVKVLDHRPFFYTEPKEFEHGSVLSIEQGYKSIDGHELQKITVERPGDVSELRDVFFHPHECDIPYTQRVILDEECLGWCNITMAHVRGDEYVTRSGMIEHVSSDVDPGMINVAYYDIEVASTPYEFPEPGEARHSVISITVYDKGNDEWLIWSYHPVDKVKLSELQLNDCGRVEPKHWHFSNERSMLQHFGRWLRESSVDMLAGWFSGGGGAREAFDWPYLVNRLNRVGLRFSTFGRRGIVRAEPANCPGILMCDLLDVHKAMSYGVLKNNKLKTVADAYLDVELEKEPGNIMNWWKRDIESLLDYNAKDVESTWLIDEVRDYTDFALTLYFKTMVDNMGDIHKASIVHDVGLLGKANGRLILPPKPYDKENVKYTGAKVLDPIAGLHENVATFDVAALYPNCIVAGNLSYETVVDGPVSDDIEVYEAPSGVKFRQDFEGVITELTREFLEMADYYKDRREAATDPAERDYWAKQYWALKILRNCFTGDTEVVTPTGVRNIKDVSVGDKVYSIDPDTLDVQVKTVIDTQEFDYEDEMVSISTSQTNFIVTPNHRMLVDNYKSRGSPKFIEAGDLSDWGRYQIPVGNAVEGERLDEFSLPYETELTAEQMYCLELLEYKDGLTRWDISHATGFEKSVVDRSIRRLIELDLVYQVGSLQRGKSKNVELHRSDVCINGTSVLSSNVTKTIPRSYDGDDWLEFVAWYITEGSLYHQQRKEYGDGNIRGESMAVHIAQKNDVGRSKIRDLLNRMDVSFSECENGFTVSNKFIYRWLDDNCGNGSFCKKIPDFVFGVSEAQRESFLRTMIDGDGDDHTGVRYTTSSDQLKDDFLKLVVELGYKPMISNDGSWRIRISKNKGSFRMGRNGDRLNNPDPDGKVYCVTVEDNHTLMAGREGKFQWVGQSIYGILGYPKFRLYRYEVAESVTLMGQEIIMSMVDWCEANGYEVVAGDTDSVLVKLQTDDVLNEGRVMAKRLTEAAQQHARALDMPRPDVFDIGFENVYSRILVAPVKKRRAGSIIIEDGHVLDEPDVKVTGFESKRADTPELSVDMQKMVFDKLLVQEKDPDIVVDDINQAFVDVVDGKYPIHKVAPTPRLAQAIEAYESNYYAMKAAKYSNEWLGTNFTQGDRFNVAYVKKVPPGYQRTNCIALDDDTDVPEGFVIDWERHADVSVKKKFETILNALGRPERLEAVGTRSLKDFLSDDDDE